MSIKVVEVIREVSPEEVEGLSSNAWEFRWIETWEEVAEVEGERPTYGDIVALFPEGPDRYRVAEVVKVIREVEPNVWEVKLRWEVEGIWLIEGIKPEEGQILDPEEYVEFLWMVVRHPFEEEKRIAVRPRFYFKKRMEEGL